MKQLRRPPTLASPQEHDPVEGKQKLPWVSVVLTALHS
jgi:hypothetical protein